MQRLYKFDSAILGFTSGIVGLFSPDMLIRVLSGLTIIFSCIATLAGMVQRLYEVENAKVILKRSETEAESAELTKQLLEKQLKKEV
jgi:hypothetical protein